ncbi:uncharacterized protein ccdc142 isoform X2 [Betta splendens]|uniref:Uncharacterized protein ccdc142 isoform X2 n=1 Tax=Betta splendens TaxID=158456 RepID=A0A9W2Y2T6_BETSP|nr:uncharacterized protein ccdc142 isoform X2 [Betta splendens]
MDWNKPEIIKDVAGDPGLTADWEAPKSEKGRSSSCKVPEHKTSNGSCSQRSISRSLQRAETLLKSTFNPNLKWLFHSRSQDEDMKEENFVVAPNLVSRSSARLLHLQHALLTVASQWQHVSGSRVCVKGLQTESGVPYLPLSSLLQDHYTSLWKLLEQRSLLLFIHEYIRRVSLTKYFLSRVSHLLDEQLSISHLKQVLSSWSSNKSDSSLRRALVQKTWLLLEIKRTLDLLGLQAMILMEQYTYSTLSAMAQTELYSVPTEVLEDIVAGVDMYNQAVEEQRAQHCTTQLRSAVLHQAQWNRKDSSLPTCRGCHPAPLSVVELSVILAAHHAEMAAKQLHRWTFKQAQKLCLFHNIQTSCSCFDKSTNNCGSSALRSETWGQLQHTGLPSSCLLANVIHHTRYKAPHCISCLYLHSTVVENQHSVLDKFSERTCKNQTSQWQTFIVSCGVTQNSENSLDKVHPTLETETDLGNFTFSNPSTTSQQHSALLFSDVCQQDCSSAKILFQMLVSFSDLMAPLVSHTPTPEAPPKHVRMNSMIHSLSPCAKNELASSAAAVINVADPVEVIDFSSVDGAQQKCVELEKPTGPQASDRDGDPVKEKTEPDDGGTKHCSVPSLQWLDLGHLQICDSLLGQYYSLIQTFNSKTLWLQLHVPHAGNNRESIILQDSHSVSQVLLQIRHALETDLVPKNCRSLLEDFSQHLLVHAAHTQWDYEMCRGLGSALKDKCVTDVSQSIQSLLLLPKRDVEVAASATMECFLLLIPPLLSSLHCHQSHSRALGSVSSASSRAALQRQTMSLVLATVQLSTVWVMSKAFRFLSSWSLNKFLLITQGDVKVLKDSLEVVVRHTKSLSMSSNSGHHSALHNHSQLQLTQQLEALDRAVCELQTFSSLVLKTFFSDCKRMSGEIFEQTMPSAVHWRPSHITGLPISPSEYASLAVQTVIGQVLESVAPLSDDARVQALSITTTAFMEAWMEHILKQKIKFSVQGALQLQQDFDFIRHMIQSDKYGLSADLHQQLLSLRVFQQVDAAVVCLLQQPQAKPYLQSRAWEPFTRCCPSGPNRGSINAAEGSSITNLRFMEGEDLSQTDASVIPSITGEPYLAPSVALGAAQQEWLNLRIQNNARHWRLPGLRCLSKSNP